MQKHFTHFFLAVLFAACLLMLAPTTSAQIPSLPTTPAPETTENLRERIEKIVEEQKEKVQSLLGQAASTRQGFIGQVTRVSEQTLAIESRGTTRIVPLDGVELQLGANTIQPDAVEVGNWALVMGVRRDESFTPKKVILSRTSLRPQPRVVYLATLQSIKAAGVDLQPRGQEMTLTARIVRATQLQDSSGAPTTLTQFSEDDQVLFIGYQPEGEAITTTLIRALAPFDRNQ